MTDALDARAPDQGRLRGHGPVARSDRASRPASPLPAFGVARRASSGWFPPGAASAHPADDVGRRRAHRSAGVGPRHAPDSGFGCRAARARRAMGRRSGAAGTPPPPTENIATAGALLHIVPPAEPQKQPDITADALRVLPCACSRCGARMIVIEVFARGCEPSWRPMPSTVDTS